MTERRLSARNLIDETAVHEAGHAVVARVLGLPVSKVTIKPQPNKIGSASVGHSTAGSDWLDREVLRGIVLCAGREAERVLLSQGYDRGDEIDRVRLAQVVDRLVDASPKADKRKCRSSLLATMRSRANALVHEHASTIETVAHELLLRRCLSGEELQDLIERPNQYTERQGAPLQNAAAAPAYV